MKRKYLYCLALCLLLSGCASGVSSNASGGQAEPVEAVSEDFAPSDTQEVAADAAFDAQVFAMDTYMELTAYGPNGQQALSEVSGLLQQLDGLLSVTEESSEIYALNHSQGQAVSVSPQTYTLLEKSLALSASVGEALDMTIYPVSRAWGFTTGEYQIPSKEELDQLLAFVDDRQVQLDPASQTVQLPLSAELDMGAVAKGYAGDLSAALLKERGVESALLNLGSSTIRTVGVKPDGSNWRIAIQDPQDTSALAGVLEIGEGAIDTTGGYERFFEGEDGEIYWHILDPKTGTPAKNGLISVTVLSEEAFLGDGLSTALFVMGLEDAVAYWRAEGGFEFVLIAEDGSLYVSEGAAEQFTPIGAYENAELTVVPYED